MNSCLGNILFSAYELLELLYMDKSNIVNLKLECFGEDYILTLLFSKIID